MPLIRTTPKRGFPSPSVSRFQILNVGDLDRLGTQAEVGPQQLFEMGLLDSRRKPLKILGQGELKKAMHVRAHAFSKSATLKIEKAGGKCESAGKP